MDAEGLSSPGEANGRRRTVFRARMLEFWADDRQYSKSISGNSSLVARTPREQHKMDFAKSIFETFSGTHGLRSVCLNNFPK